MADRKPLKVLPDSASGTGGGDSTGIGEFVAGDTLGVIDGGTGLAAVGVNQLLTGHNSSTTGALTSEANLTFDGTTLGVIGNAGVGIARTDGTLHVHTATAGSVTPNANEDDLVIENSGNCGITILAPDASDSTLCFGSTSDAVGAVLRWNHDANLLKLSTANAGDKLTFSTAADILAMTIDASQNVGIGTAAPDTNLHVMVSDASMGSVAVEGAIVESNSSTAITIGSGATSEGMLHFGDSGAVNSGRIVYAHNENDMYFCTAATERMRIKANGDVNIASLFQCNVSNTGVSIGTTTTPVSTVTKIGANGGDVINITGSNGRVGIGTVSPLSPLHAKASINNVVLQVENNAGDGISGYSDPVYGIKNVFSGYAPDNNTSYFMLCTDASAARCYIYSDGDLANHDGTYGTISDVKLKQDITDVRSYWDDFKSLQYRKFRHKTDVAADADAPFRLGLVAQEVETVFPTLVPESPDPDIETEEAVVDDDGEAVLDEDGNPTYETISTPSGTTHKWVKSSIIEGPIMGSVVQELQTRLEAAEAKITALESA
jgi:hypothetical protein